MNRGVCRTQCHLVHLSVHFKSARNNSFGSLGPVEAEDDGAILKEKVLSELPCPYIEGESVLIESPVDVLKKVMLTCALY